MWSSRRSSKIAWFALALAACSGKAEPSPSQRAPVSGQHYGAAFSGSPAVDLAALLGRAGARPDHAIQVDGMVRRSCTRRGCWLELATAMADDAPGCRVLLKDHAFFVPLDSAGSRARVEGHVDTQTVSAAVVSHMEQEGGHFPHKNPDGTATELRIIASGVELQRL